MDRSEQLKTYTVQELVGELMRRKDELDSALAIFSAPTEAGARNSKMSEAKAQYWAEWHEYKAAHPSATVTQWRRLRKRAAKK